MKSSPIRLADYVSLSRIIFCSGGAKEEVIDELIKASRDDGRVEDPKSFKAALLERERIMSTGIGYGIAIPHVKLSRIGEFFVTAGVHKRGVDWDSLDKQPVHLLFLIAGPDHLQERYLRILARITALIKDPSQREILVGLTTRFEVYQLLQSY
jgi:PTS system nitrogen regulatory IIA component